MNLLKNLKSIFNKNNLNEDWHNPSTNLQIIKETELDNIKKDVLNELKNAKVMDPKALFYIHKYIDARFSERDFDIEGRFLDKQNNLDQLYAEGKGEVYSLFTEYQEVLEKAQEADDRYRRAICELDPAIKDKLMKKEFNNDYEIIRKEFDRLPEALDWSDLNEIK